MDKAGQPYLLHPLRLMMRVETETEKIVAVLQEVAEDSQPPQRWGFDELRREGFSEPVLVALEGVMRSAGESATRRQGCRRSQRVKLADVEEDVPKIRYEGQRPASMPAWGNAPGATPAKNDRAESPIHLRTISAGWNGLSALDIFPASYLGRCPRLG